MWNTFVNWLKTNSATIGIVVAFLTALVAIITLVIQSRSMRKQMKLQNYMEYTKRYQEIILNFPESINERSFVLDDLPSSEVRGKTMRYMRAYYDLCYEEFDLHRRKFIDEDIWQIWEAGMRTAFSKPAFQQAWGKIKQDSNFEQQFEDFVAERMKRAR